MSSTLQTSALFEASLKGLLRRQRTKPTPLPTSLRLTNQTAIVTGSNIGLGLSASRQLLQHDLSHLIMGVRSRSKGEFAAGELRREFPDAQIEVWILDMESYDSIRAFAEQCAAALQRIDIVILNAGLIVPSYSTVESTGHELTLQVDYLSTVFLALLLIPLLKAKKVSGGASSRPPTLSIVGSDIAYSASLKTDSPIFPQIDNPKTFGPFAAYGKAKLLLVFFVARMAELVQPSDVLINLVNPGMTKGTSLGRDGAWIVRKIYDAVQFFLARSTDVGATTYLDAALVRGGESHGHFISDWAIKPYPPICYSEDAQDLGARLMDETMEELKPVGASLPELS